MKSISLNKTRRNSRGFGLVELLTVIGVLGIITSIALPALAHPLEKGRETRARYNAKLIVQAATNAASIGDTTVSSSPTKEAAIVKLIQGIPGKGSMSTTSIRLSGYDPAILAEATALIDFRDGTMTMIEE